MAFSDLIADRRVSHGSFRLWHCLYDHLNKKTGRCDPGQRRIVSKIGCDPHSIAGWTAELVKAGWLRILPAIKGQTFKYELLNGKGEVLGKTTTLTDVENHNTSVVEIHMGKTTTKLSRPKGLQNNKLNSSPNVSEPLPKKKGFQTGDEGGSEPW